VIQSQHLRRNYGCRLAESNKEKFYDFCYVTSFEEKLSIKILSNNIEDATLKKE